MKIALKNTQRLSRIEALKIEVSKRKVFRRDIRYFQIAVTFLLEDIKKKILGFRNLLISAISISNLQKF